MSQYPDTQNLWPDFVLRANSALKASQPESFRRFVSLMQEPHFSNHELLQVQWNDNSVRWYRSTWHKNIDSRKLYHPMSGLYYIDPSVTPTIESSSGSMDSGKAEMLWELMNGFSLSAQVNKDHGIVLDGCLHTLCFGIGQTIVRYEWNALPEAFKGLDLAVDLLFGMCRHSG